jgi:site-specific DNA-cytosine methylase
VIDAREIRHFHFCCGLGGGARGFNRANARVGILEAVFRCIGGIDSDPASIRDFERLSGVPGTVMDLFTREQYSTFHGREPPAGWMEAAPADIHRAAGNERPHIVFISAPCKGFSGLLSESRSKSAKYQALNELALRCVWLAMEAWKDDPPEFFLFENVPRIQTRGRHLLDQIQQLLSHYGYACAETTHDCGELGGLAQSRKRFLLVARHVEKVPPFLYEPVKRPMHAVGDVLGKMPLPGDPLGGPMHRIPALQWKTWVRLAFVEAGSDWRSLQKLAVADGHLRDYALVPDAAYHRGVYGVGRWEEPVGAVAGESLPSNGKFSVADPRFDQSAAWNAGQQFGVKRWKETADTVTGQNSPGQGRFAVADPRMGAGPAGPKFNNCYRVVRFDEASPAVTAGAGPTAGGLAVADPRGPAPADELHGKYHVTPYGHPSRAVIGGRDQGACYVADPRPDWDGRRNNLHVAGWDDTSHTIIGGGKGVQGGHLSVADPRPGLNREKGSHYLTAGHYGVVPWANTSSAITGSLGHDSGWGNVADPRLPAQDARLVALIRAADGTWHRPFTTLETAALQSLIDLDEYFDFDGNSDSAKRERIGNAVPSEAAQEIGGVLGTTLLLAWSGETFVLGATPIWVRPVAIALMAARRVPA